MEEIAKVIMAAIAAIPGTLAGIAKLMEALKKSKKERPPNKGGHSKHS
jgi:hypothetical protein